MSRSPHKDSAFKAASMILATAALAAAVSLPAFAPARAGGAGPEARGVADDDTAGQAGAAARFRVAQVDATDLVVRLDHLEGQVRQLTGEVEQLQYRNQQLEQQLRRMQEGGDYRSQDPNVRGGSRPGQIALAPQTPVAGPGGGGPGGAGSYGAAPYGGAAGGAGPGEAGPSGTAPNGTDSMAPAAPPPPQPGQRRGAVFDPTQNPNAPGAPRTLGELPVPGGAGYPAGGSQAVPGVGAPGGRAAGAPLDLSTMSDVPSEPTVIPGPQMSAAGQPLPPPPPHTPNATGNGQQMVMAPTATPKDEFDLAYGYVLRKDYALAEEGFREFLRKYPGDRLVPDATYWLGETMFQRQRYRDAAESFLNLTTRYQTAPKAPDALLRLGQSLAALGERDAACATFGEVGHKYPRAGGNVRQAVEREQKRVGC